MLVGRPAGPVAAMPAFAHRGADAAADWPRSPCDLALRPGRASATWAPAGPPRHWRADGRLDALPDPLEDVAPGVGDAPGCCRLYRRRPGAGRELRAPASRRVRAAIVVTRTRSPRAGGRGTLTPRQLPAAATAVPGQHFTDPAFRAKLAMPPSGRPAGRDRLWAAIFGTPTGVHAADLPLDCAR